MTHKTFRSSGFRALWRGVLLLALVLGALSARAQVGMIQWSDDHSSLMTLPQVLAAIEDQRQKFLSEFPKGEFVVLVNGDHVGLNPYSESDKGWKSIEALILLKKLGHTVVFVPGNHDAFDWNDETQAGVDLFFEHMNALHDAGVILLADNFVGLKSPLKELFTRHYELTTLDSKSRLIGLTIPQLIQKSNLYTEHASRVFDGIESYIDTFARLFSESEADDVENLYIGVHQGYHKMMSMMNHWRDSKRNQPEALVDVKLVMSAHDHMIAAFRDKGTLHTDGGCYGGFNYIQVDRDGDIRRPVQHVYVNSDAVAEINSDFFSEGRHQENPYVGGQQIDNGLISEFAQSLHKMLDEQQRQLLRVLGSTRGIPYSKSHLKKSLNPWGQVLADAQVHWLQAEGFGGDGVPIVAFQNSTSYRLENPIPAGPLTEETLRLMYPFKGDAMAFQLSMGQVREMYRTLLEFYAHGESDLYTPQFNSRTAVRDGELQLLDDQGEVSNALSDTDPVILSMDAWLAQHVFGEGYQVPEWMFLKDQVPLAKKSFQQLLVDHLPQAIAESPFAGAKFETPECDELVGGRP